MCLCRKYFGVVVEMPVDSPVFQRDCGQERNEGCSSTADLLLDCCQPYSDKATQQDSMVCMGVCPHIC